MPDEEGLALAAAALDAAPGAWLEVGSYCGRSTAYLGSAALAAGAVLVTVDHHRGSEENQPGEAHHDPALVDAEGRVETLPSLRRTLRDAGLEDAVLALVGPSLRAASLWAAPLSLLFLDGGHSPAGQHADFDAWSPHLAPGGLLAIHDVFPNPRHGGRPPYEVYLRALRSGDFEEVDATGSLRVLRRRRDHPDPAPPSPPGRRRAVVACMDARLDACEVLRISDGCGHVIRNAGGIVTDDVLRSLTISQRLLGTREVAVVHHTGCGMLTFRDDEVTDRILAETGVRPPFTLGAFADLDADVRESVARIASSPFLPFRDAVRGYVYDLDTGELREVAPGPVAT